MHSIYEYCNNETTDDITVEELPDYESNKEGLEFCNQMFFNMTQFYSATNTRNKVATSTSQSHRSVHFPRVLYQPQQ